MAQAKRYSKAKVFVNGVEFEVDLLVVAGKVTADDVEEMVANGIEAVKGATVDITCDDPRAANKLAGYILLRDRMN